MSEFCLIKLYKIDIVPENEAKHIWEIQGHAIGWYGLVGWEESNQGEHLSKRIEDKKTNYKYLSNTINKKVKS